MRERSPVPCAQPSPRGDAPSPLAFAKSCKGGDVSVLDPALAWDVRFIYLFTGHGTGAHWQEKNFDKKKYAQKNPDKGFGHNFHIIAERTRMCETDVGADCRTMFNPPSG